MNDERDSGDKVGKPSDPCASHSEEKKTVEKPQGAVHAGLRRPRARAVAPRQSCPGRNPGQGSGGPSGAGGSVPAAGQLGLSAQTGGTKGERLGCRSVRLPTASCLKDVKRMLSWVLQTLNASFLAGGGCGV